MDITIQNVRSPALEHNGRYYKVFQPRSRDELLKLHHMSCVGDTVLTEIQLEQGDFPTSFVEPTVTQRTLSGLFKDMRSIELELRDPNSTLWGKIQQNNQGALTQFFDTNVKSAIAQTANEIRQEVRNATTSSDSALSRAKGELRSAISQTAGEIRQEVRDAANSARVQVTPEGVTIGSTTLTGEQLASTISASPRGVDIIAPRVRVQSDMLVDGAVTARKMAAGSVTAEHIQAGAITGDKISVDDALIRNLTARDALIDKLTSKRIFATKIESVVSSSTFLQAYQGEIGGFTIGRFDQGRGRWISGINQFSVGMGNGEGGSYNGENTAFWANWGYSWNYPGPNAWYVTTSGNMYCRNGADFHGKVDFSNRSRVNFYSQPSFSNGAVINGSLTVSGRITYSGGEWLYSPIYNKLWKDTSQGGTWLYLNRQGDRGSDWIEMNKRISDRRYKSNIQDSQVSGLDVIEKLKTYSYRKEYDGKIEDISCGIMAQDVQKYAPEAFYENPDGAYSYRTFELVPYLIKAIQELNQKIEKMENIHG